ncbi:MAG: EAL and HDOD domain-containing protein [bacterium]
MEVFVARQPIFDRQQNVYAYELLFRDGLDNNYFECRDGDHATSTVLTNSFVSIGMETLSRGKLAFINFTRNLLLKDFATIFPKEMVAVEILEDVVPEEKIIQACKKLRKSGYLLALDDFAFRMDYEPLIELANIIKIDFMNTEIAERRSVIERCRSQKVKFLAEKVETKEVFNQAFEMGYAYFQGYFFSKPEIIAGREVPGYKLSYLQLLQEVNRPELDFDQLENIFKQDVSLSYKLLKLINSAYFGFYSKIRSIRHALALLGLREIKKWLSVIALSIMGKDKSEELVLNSLIRANLCELIAPKVGLKERASELFLMGLFSMIDAFLDQPLADILAEIPICEDIKHALSGGKNRLRDVYDLILSYEKGDWGKFSDYVANLKLAENELPELFVKAIKNSNHFLSY